MVEVVSDGHLARPVYRFGLFLLDPSARVITRNGIRIKLQDQPFELLVMLLENPGNIVSRDEIRRRLWPENTFVDFDKSLGVAVLKAREALGDTADNPRFIETVPRRGYRFVAPVQREGVAAVPADARHPAIGTSATTRSKVGLLAGLAGLVAIAVAVGFWTTRSRARIPAHAAVVIGEFTNRTGDPVFDGSLRRAVVIQLAQSQYLNVVADQKLGEILQSLGRSPDDALVPALARQVCQHGNAAALITGSIQANSGAYSLSMEAERCSDGSTLAEQKFSVDNKQQVLSRLGIAADELRRRLGESRESLEKFDVPMEQATTGSLDALKAYQLGLDLRAHSKNLEARPVLKTAITLDPNFAIAYAQLGSAYSNLGNTADAKQYFQKAFALRARATEPERLYITGRYFDIVTGELEKGSETYKLWTELYPNEWKPYNAVANDAYLLGRFETVVEFARKSVELGPDQDFGYLNLISGLIASNRIDEAKRLCQQRLAEGHDSSFFHLNLYGIGYLQHDPQAIGRELDWAQKHPDDVGMIVAQAQAAAAEGRLKESNRLFERAAKLDESQDDRESAAIALANAAEVNSEMGLSRPAQQKADEALKLGKNEIVYGLAALVAVRARDLQKGQMLLEQMDHDYPLSTFNLGVYSPVVRAAISASHGGPASEVASLMEPALPYEYGFEADMLPIYVRGVSYAKLHATDEAEAEFQKVLGHPYVDAVTTLYPLSLLGMARCYAAQGKKEESRKAYQQLFDLWKNADKDLPVLAEARREFNTLDAFELGKKLRHL